MSGMLFDRATDQPWTTLESPADRTRTVQGQMTEAARQKSPGAIGMPSSLPLDVMPKAVSLPPPSRPNRPARFKMVCSFQDFFQQKASKSSSEVAYLVGQDLEFKIVDTQMGDDALFPEPGWKWTLISGEGHLGIAAGSTWKVFRGNGSYLKTNDLFPGKWTLIAYNRLRGESCSMRLVGATMETWNLFKDILPDGRIDPDAYLNRLNQCLESDASGESCGGASESSGPRELARKGTDAELLRSRLEKRLEPSKGLKRIPVQALFTDLKSMLNFRLRVFLSIVDGKWHLTDWSCPEIEGFTGWFVGGSVEVGHGNEKAIRKAFKAWEDGNRYPRGSVHWRVVVENEPFEIHGSFGTSGQTDLDVFVEGLQYAGTGLMALQLAPHPLLKGVGKIGSNLCFAASSGLRIYQRWNQGYNTLHDWLMNGMDLAVVAFSILGMRSPSPKIAPQGEIVKVIGVGKMLETVIANGKKMSMLGRIELSGGFLMIVACHVQAGAGILAIANRKDLTTGEKVAELTKVLGMLLVQDALMFLIMRRDLSQQVHMEGAEPPAATPSPKPLAGHPETSGKTDGTSVGGRELPVGEKPNAGSGEHLETPHAETATENGKSSESKSELNLDEIPGAADGERHETVVSRKRPKESLPKKEGEIPPEKETNKPERRSEEPETQGKPENEAVPPQFGMGQEVFERIRETPQFQRPPKSAYWTDAQFAEWRQIMEKDGTVSFFITELNFQRFINTYKSIGGIPNPPHHLNGSQFVISRSTALKVQAECGTDLSKYEVALGIPRNELSDGWHIKKNGELHPQDLILVSLELKPEFNLRPSDGNESFANSDWRPDAHTPGGMTEGVIDQTSSVNAAFERISTEKSENSKKIIADTLAFFALKAAAIEGRDNPAARIQSMSK
ncbi:MAG TPA: hypothetical protein PKY05_07620 [Fibrobacteria bacterium]|nr:hypothetical protein [Fibrobacteria bacterium]